MDNPERINKPTPNGGAYSEIWLLDKDGFPAKSRADVTQSKILEFSSNDELIQTTYVVLKP